MPAQVSGGQPGAAAHKRSMKGNDRPATPLHSPPVVQRQARGPVVGAGPGRVPVCCPGSGQTSGGGADYARALAVRGRAVQRMMNDGEEKVPFKPKKQTGPYNNDPPKEFEQDSWDAIKVVLGLNDDSLKKKILILGGKDETYDCFNWSLGYRNNAEPNVPSKEDEVDNLYATYGFNRTKNLQAAKIVVFARNGRAIHVAVKVNITYEGNGFETWTSKLGESLLISHPLAKTIINYYPQTDEFWVYE